MSISQVQGVRYAVSHIRPGQYNPAVEALGTMATDVDVATAGLAERLGRQQVPDGQMHALVYTHDAADPTLLTDAANEAVRGPDGLFHAFTTQSPYGPGDELVNLPHLTSPNLRDWTFAGDALPELPAGVTGDTWAPDVFRMPGSDRTFMTYSAEHAPREGIEQSHKAVRLLSADDVNGPWTDHGVLVDSDSTGHTIDSSTFTDPRDGQSYLYVGSGPEGLFGGPLHLDPANGLPTLSEPPRQVFEPNLDRAQFEGMSEAAKVGMNPVAGRPQVWYSGDHWGNHYALKVAEAPNGSALGPFTETRPDPIVDSNRIFTQPGHHEMFSVDGREFALVHTYVDGARSRSLALVEVERAEDGWPVVNGGHGIPVTPRPAPAVDA